MKGPREHLLELLLFLLVNGGPLRVRGHPVDGCVVRRVGHPGDETSHTHTLLHGERKVKLCFGARKCEWTLSLTTRPEAESG